MKRPAGHGVGRRSPAVPALAVALGCCAIPLAWAVAAEAGVSAGGRAQQGGGGAVRVVGATSDGTVRSAPFAQGEAAPVEPPVAAVVAVEPFANISRDPADAWLGAGIAETVAADLGMLGLAVVEAHNAGAPSGAGWLVTGGYQRLGERLRITARLVAADSGAVARSVRLDGALDEIFALQDRIVAELTAGIDLQDPIASALTADVDLGAAAPRPGTPAPAGLIEGIILPRPTVDDRGERATGAGEPASRVQAARSDGSAAPAEVGSAAVRAAPVPAARPDGSSPAPAAGDAAAGAAGPLAAGLAPAAGILTGRPSVEPVRVTDAPRIDGRLDDAVWRRAARITEFVQQQPLDGAPATEETELYLAYDTQNLYFGVHVHYSDPVLIRANRSDRDQTFSDDTITLYFDPFLDQQRAYVFSVNGYGVQSDAILDSSTQAGGMGGGGRRSGGGGGGRPGSGGGGGGGRPGGMSASLAAALGGAPTGDTSWDALFESSGTLVDDGWTAEMAIPFKSLRYPSRRRGERHRWGFQVVRTILSKNETDVWAPISRDVAGFLPQMGLLDGLTDLSTSRNLEILPTLTAIQFGSLDTGTGVFEDGDPDPEGGVNVKYGVTPNLTFDYTYNPDFSQIESDIPQIEVNQRFPLFYPELRPFFLEGQEIFQVPGQVNLVHTRTIVDPRQGAKLTGKVGNTTVGVLVANDEAPGLVDDVSPDLQGRTAQVAIARARYDLYAESYLGVIATDREFGDGFSRVGGVDGRFRLGRTSSVSFQAAASEHRNDTDGYSSGPIFHLAYDRVGRNLSYSAAVDSVDPGFRTDTGFVQRVDTRVAQANVSYRWWPENWLVNWGPLASYSRNFDYEGILQDEQANVGVRGVLTNSIIWVAMANRDMERYEGIEFYKTNAFLGGGFAASRRLSAGGFFNWGDQVRYGDDPFLGSGATATLFASVRPMSRLNADLNFITSRLHDPRTAEQVFDVKIYRALTTYQFTNRLLLRNILEYNAFSGTVAANLLFTYRVNAGTVFFVGYDDHYQQGDLIDSTVFPTMRFEQTNRAIFTKLSYLFRF